ncbi:MAG: hypothetical protein U0228_25200 [Myxococcaceae bacterium]
MPALSPLQCRNCGSHVPLAPGDAVPCPACQQPVEVPAEYRALRDAHDAADRTRVAAHRLYASLGKAPNPVWRAFLFTESALFWAVGLPVWMTIGSGLSLIAMGVVGRALHANAFDVLAQNEQVALTMALPLGVVVLGLLFSGWARQRVVKLGGLQAALAAGPSRAGGVAGCRSCGAPLHVATDALGARCPYCEADNLVRVPPAWLERMKKHTAKVEQKLDAGVKAFEEARSSLRTSLILRAVFGALLLTPTVIIARSREPDRTTLDSFEAWKNDSAGLPSWSEHVGKSLDCSPGNLAFLKVKPRQEDCRDEGCAVFKAIAVRAGETVSVVSPDAQGLAWLDERDVRFLDEVWKQVGKGPLPTATFKVELSGWYRARAFISGASAGQWVTFCVSAR